MISPLRAGVDWLGRTHPVRWLGTAPRLNRAIVLGLSFSVGCLLGGFLYLYLQGEQRAKNEREHNAEQIRRLNRNDRALAALVRELAALKNPTAEERRAMRRRLIEEFTPAEVRLLGRTLLREVPTLRRERAPRRPPSGSPSPQPRRPAPRPPPTPVIPDPPDPPRPPDPDLPGPGEPVTLDLPPFDPDGPDGPLPILDPPPVTLPLLPPP